MICGDLLCVVWEVGDVFFGLVVGLCLFWLFEVVVEFVFEFSWGVGDCFVFVFWVLGSGFFVVIFFGEFLCGVGECFLSVCVV